MFISREKLCLKLLLIWKSHEDVKLEELEWQASLLRNTINSSIPMYNCTEEIH